MMGRSLTSVHAGRIGWFLNLQKAAPFPRYSMAPISRLLGLRRMSVDRGESEASMVSKTSALPIQPRRLIVFRANIDAGIIARRSPVAAWRNHLPGHRSMPSASDVRAGGAALAVANFSQARLQRGKPIQDTALTNALRRVGSSTGRNLTFVAPADVFGSKSATRSGFAPGRPSGGMQEAEGATIPTLSRQSIHRGDYLMSHRNISPSNAYPSAARILTDGTASNSTESGAAEPVASQQHRPPSASTLHLDGAALGRWAVQHLSRTLGKPTTGITGVDPRMNSPRSRVQPF